MFTPRFPKGQGRLLILFRVLHQTNSGSPSWPLRPAILGWVSQINMDQSTDDYRLDLGGFDIRDFVSDNAQGLSMFSDHQKNGQGQQRSPQEQLQSSAGHGLYDYSRNSSTAPGNGSSSGVSGTGHTLDQLQMLVNMNSAGNLQQDLQVGSSQNNNNMVTTTESLREQLAQQIKLQQLQQLQNHILQQQVGLFYAFTRCF